MQLGEKAAAGVIEAKRSAEAAKAKRINPSLYLRCRASHSLWLSQVAHPCASAGWSSPEARQPQGVLRPKTAPPAAEKARELFFWDRAKTQWIRELILNDKIRHIVNEATSVRLVESEGDPTRVEHVRAMQLIFEHATDGLIRDMGKAAFSAFLHELTDGLQHEEFERYVASLIMNRHIDHEALREKENRHVVEQELRSLDDL